MQGSTDGRVGPNFKIGFRDPRTANLVPRSCKIFLMVKITEVPTISIVLNLLYHMQQKFRRSTIKKVRITLERNWLIQDWVKLII